MLKHADDDAGRDSLPFGERPNRKLAARRRGDELFPLAPGNQGPRRPLVRLLLFKVGPAAVQLIDENTLLAVKQDVRGFVEEAEPEVVIRLVACTELDHRLPGREPPGRSAECGLRKRPDQGKRDPRPIAKLPGALQRLANRLSRQAPNLLHRLPESGLTVVRAVLTFGFKLAQPKPGRQRCLVAPETWRVPIGDIRNGMAGGPGIYRADAKERKQLRDGIRFGFRRLEGSSCDQLGNRKALRSFG